MVKIIFFELFVLVLCVSLWLLHVHGNFPLWLNEYALVIDCIFISTIAGVLYCLRAIYKNKCVRGSWDENWHTWYYLRPITSGISGLITYVFLKAGLLVLSADGAVNNDSAYGYLAFAFIAGLNVDKFTNKVEEIGQAVFGVETSRSYSVNNDSKSSQSRQD